MSNAADPAEGRPQKRPRLDDTYKQEELISFQLVHFRTPKAGNSTSLRFADDSDYGDSENEEEEPQAKKKRGRPPKTAAKKNSDSPAPRMFPVMEDTFYMRYFRCHKSMKLEVLAEMLASKMAIGDDFTVHFMNVRAFHLENRELPHDMTLGQIATELSWKRRRPMRLVFTLLPTKQMLMSPSLDAEGMPQLELQDNENVEKVVFDQEPSPPPPMLCSAVPTTAPQLRVPPNLVPLSTLTRSAPVAQAPKRPVFLQQLPPGIPQQMRVVPPPQGFPHQTIQLPPGFVPDQLRMCQILQQQPQAHPQYIFQQQQTPPQIFQQQQQQQKIFLQQAAIAQQRQLVAQHQMMEQNKQRTGGYAAQIKQMEREKAARAQAQAIEGHKRAQQHAQQHLQQVQQRQKEQLAMQMRRNQELKNQNSGQTNAVPPHRLPSHAVHPKPTSSSASTPTSSTASPAPDLHKASSSSTPSTPAHSQPSSSKISILPLKLSTLDKLEKHINPNLRPFSAKVQVRALPMSAPPAPVLAPVPAPSPTPEQKPPKMNTPEPKPFVSTPEQKFLVPKQELKPLTPSEPEQKPLAVSPPAPKPKLGPLPVPPIPPLPKTTTSLATATSTASSEAGIDAGTLAKMKGQKLGKTLVANAFVRKPSAPQIPASSSPSSVPPQDSPSSSAPTSTDTSANTSPASSTASPSTNKPVLQGFSAETVNGEIQISASAERLNMLRNSTIVHSM